MSQLSGTGRSARDKLAWIIRILSVPPLMVTLLIAVLLAGLWGSISRVDKVEQSTQTQMVEDAVKNAALSCYAVEGAYPSELSYLKEHYGLSYDEKRYRVTYSAFASNLVPEIFVTEMEAEVP